MTSREYATKRARETRRPYLLVSWPETDFDTVLVWADFPENRRTACELEASIEVVRG